MLKTSPKLSRIRVLMLISQALLVCFMVYWLRSEYFGEREVLRKDLTMQLERAQHEISDSVITVTILNPIMEGMSPSKIADVQIKVRDTVRDELIGHGSSRMQLEDHGNSIFTKEEKFILHPDYKYDPKSAHGVRLTVNSTRSILPGMANDLIHLDTALLSRSFHKAIDTAGIPVTAHWISSSQAGPARGLYLTSFSRRGYNMQIGAYSGYLLQKMIPQFLFTLILLSLTAIAFLVTYRSLSAQMHLAAIRNNFISNMSHELKTPVSTVKVALEAISEPEVLQDLPTAQDYIRMASLEMARLELLINQALQNSLMEEGKIFMQTEPVNLRILVDELIRTMQPRFTLQGACIETEVSGNDFTVPADKLQVQGVVINILDNALKYAGPSPAIKLSISEQTDGVLIAISDNGPGIPEAYAGRIFDKFFRVPRGNEHGVKGYGLGLSYAAQVMKLHGGNISMQAAPGGGCMFLLHFRRSVA